MKNYEQAKKNEKISGRTKFKHDGLNYSSEYKNHIILIANTIARHNMWTVNYQVYDVVRKYKEYGLEHLIIGKNGENKISPLRNEKKVKDNFLFLLVLVDTLDPVKVLGKNNRYDVYNILNDVQIGFYNENKLKEIAVKCHNNIDQEYYIKGVDGISDWLEVKCINRNDTAVFQFQSLIQKVHQS